MPTLLAVNRNIAVFGHLKWRGGLSSIFFQKDHKRASVDGSETPNKKLVGTLRYIQIFFFFCILFGNNDNLTLAQNLCEALN